MTTGLFYLAMIKLQRYFRRQFWFYHVFGSCFNRLTSRFFVIKQALEFDGDYVDCGGDESLAATIGLTITNQ
jgi:hypothetical protein